MQASRVRVEIIRFGLLLVVTVGLLSVAARAFDDNKASVGASGAHPSATSSSSSPSPDAVPTQSSAAPDGGTSSSGDGSAADGTGGDSGTVSDTGTGSDMGSGSGGTGDGAIAAPELPRTGPDTVLRLTGLALVLIAGGSFSLAGARRSA